MANNDSNAKNERPRCPYCDQEIDSTEYISILKLRILLAHRLCEVAMESLDKSTEPAVLERALLVLDVLSKID